MDTRVELQNLKYKPRLKWKQSPSLEIGEAEGVSERGLMRRRLDPLDRGSAFKNITL